MSLTGNRIFAAVISCDKVPLNRGHYKEGSFDTDTERVKAILRQRQRLKGGIYAPRNVKEIRQPPDARLDAKGGFCLRISSRNQPCQHLDFRLLASISVLAQVSFILSCPVCGNLVQWTQT
jgi:hypothetical protein